MSCLVLGTFVEALDRKGAGSYHRDKTKETEGERVKRSILCIASVLVLMAAVFRMGCQVEIGGQVLPGVYDPAIARRSAQAAGYAAEEICRENEAPPFRLRPVLCARYTPVDEDALARAMLSEYEGVSVLYAVYAGETRIGTTADPGMAGTLYEERMAAQTVMAADAPVSRPVTMKKVFTYPECVTDAMEMSRALGEATEVTVTER